MFTKAANTGGEESFYIGNAGALIVINIAQVWIKEPRLGLRLRLSLRT